MCRFASWRLAGTLLAGLLVGCATFRPLDPAAGSIELAENEGILVVHLRSQVPLSSLSVRGVAHHDVARDLPAGEHLYFLAAPRGRYRWSRLEREIGAVTYWWDLRNSDAVFDFTIEPGVINYPGLFVVESTWSSLHLAFRSINRSAMAVSDLERRHASLLERFPIRYAGVRRDDFLARYLETRARLERTNEEPGPP